MTWIVGWRSNTPGDPCHSLVVSPPFHVSGKKEYIQFRASIINEPPRTAANSNRFYTAPPSTGAARNGMPRREGVTKDTKFTLQQVVAYAAYKGNSVDIWQRIELHDYFETGWQTLELSHRCSNKRCTEPSHIIPESSADNKARHGCPVLIFINKKPYPHCDHEPPCIASYKTLQKAKHYTVTQEDLDQAED